MTGSNSPHPDPAVVIRFLTPDDYDQYWHLRLEMLEGEPYAFGSSPKSHRQLSEAEIRTRISFDADEKFVAGAFVGGQLAGTVGFVREHRLKERHKGRVWGVCLKPEFRGRGIAGRMMASVLEQAARIDGLEQIQLRVASGQTAAIALYRAAGFEFFARELRALKVGERHIDEDYMVLWLNQR